MRVLITGGAGFVGSHVADVLTERGHEVRLLDLLVDTAHGGGRPPAWVRGYDTVLGDVRSDEVLDSVLSDVDVVCHQAAVVGHGLDPSDAPRYTAHNDHGTAVLLAAMFRAGVQRLVLASSMVVYGEGRYACREHGVTPPAPRRSDAIAGGRFEPPCPHCGSDLEPLLVPEDAPLDPRSVYAASKVAQEHLASAWARQTGGDVWALRYHNVYGPRMPRDTPYAGVASLFRSRLERGDEPVVLEDGGQRRDFVHVRDVALANALAVERPTEGLTPVNVCSGEPHTVGELAAELSRAMAGPEPRIVGGARPGDVRHVVADPARARELLGFQSSVPFAAGVTAFATDPLRSSAGLG
ncbi:MULTISPECIES: NAD-dependent epimerase/dehydratase family protein [Prauserella salsuginis group]|uniref:dTDP-L-rhamnose 4-epimerase n=2 Tax=Prauserella salsuginis group TaxID=2893672 RepID=A0A839Y036_9PSEU|nr:MULTISPECIES: NAD-dependent epimerase/dehydratase family protein [Prauserella salsuginis group]MBB3665656.1 dTDP-L-rhamnose 4-epimerase [Prauserella sediminis]MCR3718076.1 dTDP-L-rhamnose 4-epimerase [Prauserella flava]MCR3732646.1 dTDP-L-rhamnose 4-epimerase [Prauserella salsuginis]